RPGQFFGKSGCSTATLRQGKTFGKMSDGRDGVLYAGFCQLTIINRGLDDHLSGVCVTAALKQSTRTLGGPPHSVFCLILHRMGFTEPGVSPRPLVVSYSTLSPLPL